MATFGAKFLRTIDKSRTNDCQRNLSSTMLKVIKWYIREIKNDFTRVLSKFE